MLPAQIQFGAAVTVQVKNSIRTILLLIPMVFSMAGVVWAPVSAAVEDSSPCNDNNDLPDFTFEKVETSKSGEIDNDTWDDLLATHIVTIFLQHYKNAFPGYHLSRGSRYTTSSLIIRAPPLQ